MKGNLALETRSIPKIWPGSTIAIIGGGPSIKEIDTELLFSGKCRTIGVNHGFRIGPVDVLWFGDHSWYEINQASVNNFAGLKLTCDTRLPEMPWPHHIKRIRRCQIGSKPEREGLHGIESQRPDYVRWNNNSGGSAINVAYHLGASRILLLGFDMRRVGAEAHFHDFYPKRKESNDPYKRHLDCFPQIAIDAHDLGLEIINCTPDSAITQFPFMTLNEALGCGSDKILSLTEIAE